VAWNRAVYRAILPPEPADPAGRATWREARRQVAHILRSEGRNMVREAKRRAPRRRGSGKLRRQIHLRMTVKGREVTASVLSATFYSAPTNARGRTAGWWDSLRWPESVDVRAIDAFASTVDIGSYINARDQAARRIEGGLSRLNLFDALFGPDGTSTFRYTIRVL